MTLDPATLAAAEPVCRLKTDLFGCVEVRRLPDGTEVSCRDTAPAPRWVRPLARWLARREQRALAALPDADGLPALLHASRDQTWRRWVAGEPMHLAAPQGDQAYFRDALALMCRLHRANITHNDCAKEPNWLVRGPGQAGLIDFQLAVVHRRRGWLFRLMAREDLRHLLKHKRRYCRAHLTARQRHMLATPSLPARLWRATGKRLYRFITRRLLGWRDREGAGDRDLRVPGRRRP